MLYGACAAWCVSERLSAIVYLNTSKKKKNRFQCFTVAMTNTVLRRIIFLVILRQIYIVFVHTMVCVAVCFVVILCPCGF